MKMMSVESQKSTNGGYTWWCAACGWTYWELFSSVIGAAAINAHWLLHPSHKAK